MKYTVKALLRKWVENEGGFVFGSVLILYVFSVFSFWLVSITLGSRGQSELYTFWHKYNFLQFHDVFCRWVNDETCLNVKSSRVLEKGTFECGNVGF